MFAAGPESAGRRWIETTVCPRAILDAPGNDSTEVVDWWLYSTTFGPNGPAGPPQWPDGLGYLETDAKIVDAAEILRNAWPLVTAPRPERAPAPEPAPEPMRRKRR